MVTQDMMRTHVGEEKNRLVTALELTKCLKQIE